jgi:hypothetical protein
MYYYVGFLHKYLTYICTSIVLTVESQVKVNLFDIKSRPERYPNKEAQTLEKELPRNGNLDDSAHDGNLLDNITYTNTKGRDPEG